MPKKSDLETLAFDKAAMLGTAAPEGGYNQEPMTLRRAASGGGKLSRSETVTVRLDPKLNYLCELAARSQRRTKSSFIEWAVAEALERVPVPGTNGGTIDSYSEFLWDVEEADRLAQMAFQAAPLMTHEEQLIWKLVESCGLIWTGNYYGPDGEWRWATEHKSFRWDKYREHYQTFKDVAEGVRPKSDLPTWAKRRPQPTAFDTDVDDDVPF